ncbi:MAG: peptidoglycan-binding protein [Oscillospiraceae bacterium]|nr:peptidoglycan-binding protein [Oscillospiraceae bacterium]
MEKTAKGLVEYAKAQLGRPYWNGSFGQAASKEFYEEKKNQYPKKYQWEYDPAEAGIKVHDCVGLIKGYMFCKNPEDTNPIYNEDLDMNESMMWNACKTKGDISTIPDVPGILVFKTGHVGVYIGGGEVIEARGRSYGVVKTRLADRGWTGWGYYPYITYEAPKKEEPKQEAKPAGTITLNVPVLKRGMKGDTVEAMQILLLGHGYKMTSGDTVYGADGSFGGATERALKKFQADRGLEPDGSCGPLTWAKLLGVGT